ncbi:MAG: Hsp20/alpha crystallin family protein [Prolixibacteraceae bacterium]|nr:Hsp20/alpha crystallin family protein [Prolixibacteraceae bacterium]
MNIVRFENPVYRYGMNNRFNNQYRHRGEHKSCKPAVNISNEDNNYVLEFSVPGYRKDQFSITSNNDILTVKANVEDDQEEQGYNRREFSVHSFERTFNIPEDVNIENVNAKYENGILKVVLPKLEEKLKNKELEIAVQ